MPAVIPGLHFEVEGNVVKKCVLHIGWQISKVARDTGISRTTLTNIYYKRSTYITFAVLNKLCEYLECGVDDLFPYVADIERR